MSRFITLVFTYSLCYIFINSLLSFVMFLDIYNRICCEKTPSYPIPYEFDFGSDSSQKNKETFQSNEIKTTKYNIFNFLPKSIIIQYRRLANLYFLIVAIISTIPNVTPLSPGLIWAPMVFVIFISMIKELYEDYNRYKMDKQVNDQKQAQIIREGELIKIKWKDILVGDICKIKQQQTFPADLVLISSSDKDGVAFIQTASLDGQLTSKLRCAFQELNNNYSNDKITDFKGHFNGDIPNYSLSEFKGTISIGNNRYVMTDNNQLLFRGTKLKNTEWIWGLTIYTGQCSKIMMNGQSFVTKLSSLQRKLNYLLIVMLAIQISACIGVSFLSVKKQLSLMSNQSYLIWPSNYGSNQIFLMNFLLYFIEFSSCIPVSLIVTIQIAKTVQSYFIDFDQLMYSSWRKKRAYAKIASLNEQLGQIEYIFCDKTGTLTKNQLKFHTAVIGTRFYQFQYHSDKKTYRSIDLQNSILGFNKSKLSQERISSKSDISINLNNHSQLIQYYLVALLVCNNISNVGDEQNVKYESQSPDQIAMAEMARDIGYKFLKRDKNSIIVMINKVKQRIEIVTTFPFSSERKRMSVIIKWKGSHILFTKGADNVIFARGSDIQLSLSHSIKRLCQSGLRTLLVAFKVIPNALVLKFMTQLEISAIDERQIIKESFAEQFQNKLTIIGATGLLDQLQDGVPETLKDFQRAGIKVWMLTGDKLQTAIEVGKSCNLIQPQYEVILMRDSLLSLSQIIQQSRLKILNSLRKYSLVIEGSVLNKILNQSQLEKQFAQFTLFFSSVICCRLLPAQKSKVVRIVKKHLQKLCLAVGDGGNDVSMIKQAHIGIGIYGQEGMSAVQASDYAIPQFRMLWRLLFVHGRWNYIRICQMVLYFVYKSIVFTVPRFIFNFSNAYSGYPIYDDYYIALYNVVFTALPLIIRALFEQDFNYIVKKQFPINENYGIEISEQLKYLPKGYSLNVGIRKLFPKIYYVGQKNLYFNAKQCVVWVLQAFAIGACIYFISIRSLGGVSIKQSGIVSNLRYLSVNIFTAVVLINTVKLCMQVKHWTKLLLITIIFLSLAPYIGFIWFLNYYFNQPVKYIMQVCFTTAKGYLSISLMIIILMSINGIMVYVRFQSINILKKMSSALQEDEQMISYISLISQQNNGESLRQSDNVLDQRVHNVRSPTIVEDIQQ